MMILITAYTVQHSSVGFVAGASIRYSHRYFYYYTDRFNYRKFSVLAEDIDYYTKNYLDS